MNALDDNCKSVIVVVEGEPRYNDSYGEKNGYHAVCALPEPLCTSNGLEKLVKSFCDANHVSHISYPFSDAVGLLQEAKKDGVSVVEKIKTPLTLVTAHGDDKVQSLIEALLRPSPKGSYCLVTVLDLTHMRDDEPNKQGDPSCAWLVSEPSYVSELKEFGSMEGDARCHIAPFHMYCCYPLVRDCGMQCSVETFLASSSNKCTFDSILRELAFKAGQVAKYGN